MRIAGLERFTLSDYPGKVAAIVFTQGCNFRCPFCHNGQLIPLEVAPDKLIPEEEVLAFLESRRGKLDGVVLCGGEPTLQPDLADFLRKLRSMGFLTKLDTNGSLPGVLKSLFAQNLLDFVAMDIKTSLEGYDRLTGVKAPLAAIKRSIDLIANSGVGHLFRTTVVKPLMKRTDLDAILELVPKGSPYVQQKFVSDNAYDLKLRELDSDKFMDE